MEVILLIKELNLLIVSWLSFVVLCLFAFIKQKKQCLMKVILPILEKRKGKATIAKGFHNARFMCIYDSEAKTYSWKNAEEIIAGTTDLSREFESMGIDSVICGYLPPMVWQIFSRSHLRIYRPRGNSFSENIDFFDKNQLELFSNGAANKAWQECGRSCASCNTNCS